MANAIEWNNEFVMKLIKAGAVLLVIAGIIFLAATGIGAVVIGAVGTALSPFVLGI